MRVLAPIVIGIFLAATTSFGSQTEFHFDFGPADSAVEEGFDSLDSSAVYTAEQGFGWIDGAPVDYIAPKPELNRSKWWHLDPHFFFDEIINDLRRDGVESEESFSFKIDAPKGRYRVVATMGHMNDARYGMDIYANGQLAAKNIKARHCLGRARVLIAPGYYRRVRFSVDVGEEGLRLDFKGDDAEFQRLYEIEMAIPKSEWPISRLKHEPMDKCLGPWRDIGGPFSKISIIGLEVYPESEFPLALDPETLKLNPSGGYTPSGKAATAIEAFNAGEFEKAEQLFLQTRDPEIRGIGLLALAGRPEHENEAENVEAAIASLKEAYKGPDANPRDLELLESAEVFFSGLENWRVRQVPPNNSPRSTWRAISEIEQCQAEDFLYWKAQVLKARWLIMLDAHQFLWASSQGRILLREIEKVFPDNRYVQFYLHGKVANAPEWIAEDYLARVPNAPDWARGIYACYNLQLDFAEWWADNKQEEDGSVGGGWGDDVELVGLFGFTGRISEGASPKVIDMANKLVTGCFELSGDMDNVGGFFHNAADTEHSAEWSGKTLPMMLVINPGNPRWFEEALKSAKLMKDMWMGVNDYGHLHWRSNFLGGSGIGAPATHLDSAINWRAARPIEVMSHITRNPTLCDMIVRHATALYEDAMRTDKGKPKGFIPGDVDYETDEIGGRNVETWYDPGPIPAASNYGFSGFHPYRCVPLELAYNLTRDSRFVEPMRIEAEFVLEQLGEDLGKGQKKWKNKPGTEKWMAFAMRGTVEYYKRIQYQDKRRAGEDVLKHTQKSIAELTIPVLPEIRKNWPYVTTEAIATDRVHFPGAINYLEVLSGFHPVDVLGHVTYRHVGRDFAAAVLGGDATSITLAAYLFDFDGSAQRTIGVVPWKLDLGAEYRAVWGPDVDGDDQMDSEEGETEFKLLERGQTIDFNLNTDATYIIKIMQTVPSPLPPLLADLAIGPEDIEYHERWGLLFVTVHNIGAVKAEEFEVIVTDTETGKTMQAVGTELDAPLDLTPKRTRFGFQFQPTQKTHTFDIEIKSRKNQPEIGTRNNALTATVEF